MRRTILTAACVLLAGCATAPVRDDAAKETVDLLAPLRAVIEELDRTIVEGDYDAYRPHCCVGFESDEVARRVFDALRKAEYIGYRDRGQSSLVECTRVAAKDMIWQEFKYEGQLVGYGFRGYRVRYQVSKGPEGERVEIVGIAEDARNEQGGVTAGVLLPVGYWQIEGRKHLLLFPDPKVKFGLSIVFREMEWQRTVDEDADGAGGGTE